ncbi:hypothetical protein N9U55_01615 [Luminiphilus sp.]|nr:hypothetical protein [Luminiphilus sp.]MDA9721960.1 hypothetical protein [Luminiphilus sp.]
MLLFYATFPFLAFLGLSYLLAARTRPVSVELAYWLITYQFVFIGALGIGLVQSRVGCPVPLAECYVDGYPEELDIFWFFLELAAVAWVLCALAMSLYNLVFSRRLGPRS